MIFIYGRRYAIKRRIVPVLITLKEPPQQPLRESLGELGIADDHGSLECSGAVSRLPHDQVAFVATDKHGREILIRLNLKNAEEAMELVDPPNPRRRF